MIKLKKKRKKNENKTNCSSSSSSSSSGVDMISNASSSSSNNSNLMIGNNDYNLISAAEQISAIINNVMVNNTHNLTSSPAPFSPSLPPPPPPPPPPPLQPALPTTSTSTHSVVSSHQSKLLSQQTIAKESINRMNNLIMSSDSSVKKSQIDLLKLLERANLTQYMQAFIQQGIKLFIFSFIF